MTEEELQQEKVMKNEQGEEEVVEDNVRDEEVVEEKQGRCRRKTR